MERTRGFNIIEIESIEDIELDYKNVWIDSKDNTRIDFDIAVELTAEVEGVSGKNRDRESYTSTMWIMVYCSGTLINKLNDFKILSIEEYSKSKPKKPLSGDFVPYIKKSEYDVYADEILNKFYYKFYPDAKKNPGKINVTLLANNMGLSVITRSISHDQSIFGQIFFDDVNLKLYNDKTLEYESVNIKRNTILVDNNAGYL